jgi:hypothetical protein
MDKKTIKQGEANHLTFTILDDDGVPVNLTGASFFLGVKRNKKDGSYAFSHSDGDFNKTAAASGVVSVFLTTTDTNRTQGDYCGELKITMTGTPTPIYKTVDVPIEIIKAVIT